MWFSWKVELCSEHRLSRRLDFHVNMACSTRILSGDNSFQVIAPLLVRELVAAQLETSVVVIPVAICLPEVQPGMSNWLACSRKHVSRDCKGRSRKVRFS